MNAELVAQIVSNPELANEFNNYMKNIKPKLDKLMNNIHVIEYLDTELAEHKKLLEKLQKKYTKLAESKNNVPVQSTPVTPPSAPSNPTLECVCENCSGKDKIIKKLKRENSMLKDRKVTCPDCAVKQSMLDNLSRGLERCKACDDKNKLISKLELDLAMKSIDKEKPILLDRKSDATAPQTIFSELAKQFGTFVNQP